MAAAFRSSIPLDDHFPGLQGSVGVGALEWDGSADLDAELAGIEVIGGAFENGALALLMLAPAEHRRSRHPGE